MTNWCGLIVVSLRDLAETAGEDVSVLWIVKGGTCAGVHMQWRCFVVTGSKRWRVCVPDICWRPQQVKEPEHMRWPRPAPVWSERWLFRRVLLTSWVHSLRCVNRPLVIGSLRSDVNASPAVLLSAGVGSEGCQQDVYPVIICSSVHTHSQPPCKMCATLKLIIHCFYK